MSNSTDTREAAQAAERFAEALAGPLHRIEARLGGPGGMARLCAIESVFARALPAGVAKELVWLTPQQGGADQLQLRAFGPDDQLLAASTVALTAGG